MGRYPDTPKVHGRQRSIYINDDMWGQLVLKAREERRSVAFMVREALVRQYGIEDKHFGGSSG